MSFVFGLCFIGWFSVIFNGGSCVFLNFDQGSSWWGGFLAVGGEGVVGGSLGSNGSYPWR